MRLLPALLLAALACSSAPPPKARNASDTTRPPGAAIYEASLGGTVTVRKANAAGDTVWVKVSWALPAGGFPAATDSIAVDYLRGGAYQFTHHTRATVDSGRVATGVTAGQTQTFAACTVIKDYGVSPPKSLGPQPCSAPVSWTAPLSDSTSTPSVQVIGLLMLPNSVAVDSVTKPTAYVLTGLTESATTARGGQVQFCTFAHWSDSTWGRVTNDVGVARCDNLWATLPLPNKVARLARPYDRDRALRLASR